jgi:hypothetical protein
MNTAEQILVVMLSTALAVLLILAIVALINVIRLLKVLQLIAAKAEGFVESAEATADMVKSAVGQLSLMRFVQSIVDLVKHRHGDNNKGDSKHE